MYKTQKAFTLIELMIVVAIIGILAAIAIPLYQNYIVKTQTTRAFAELRGSINLVESQLQEGNYPTSAMAIGVTESSIQATNGVEGQRPLIDFSANDGTGTITFTFGNSASAAITGATMAMSRSINDLWSCATSAGTSTSWKANYQPPNCS